MPSALIIVDVQHDFLPGGALGVPAGDTILHPIRELARTGGYDAIIASQDWHPRDHCSFAQNGGTWPPHCVQGTIGADLHPAILDLGLDVGVAKGTSSYEDAYSAFDGRPSLQALLTGYTNVDVVGLALDYCVRATATDAAMIGYHTRVWKDGTKAVVPEEADKVYAELVHHGCEVG